MQEQQLHHGHVAVPGGVVQGGVVLVARGVHQRPVLQQRLHHRPVPVVTRLVLGGERHRGTLRGSTTHRRALLIRFQALHREEEARILHHIPDRN